MTRTRIKICGLTREADVDAAVAAGADALGFMLYPRSARHVSLARAEVLASRLPPFVTPVLVFVNATPAELHEAAARLPQALLQFHGDEQPADCALAGRPYIRAVRMAPGVDLLDFASPYWRPADAGGPAVKPLALLLDAHADGYGGSGKVFDWSQIPPAVPLPVVLSGGLSPANVIDGIARVRPWAVDVSSGVELSKGVKCPELLRRFCGAVRQADAQQAARPLPD